MDNLMIEAEGKAFSDTLIDNEYVHAATSDNTRRAYQTDVEHFIKMSGELPATPQMVASYLKECTDKINPRTLARRLTAIRQWHKLKGDVVKDPTQDPLVTKTIHGIDHIFMVSHVDKL